MEDIQRLRLQYGAAMAHQEVFQQHIIILSKSDLGVEEYVA